MDFPDRHTRRSGNLLADKYFTIWPDLGDICLTPDLTYEPDLYYASIVPKCFWLLRRRIIRVYLDKNAWKRFSFLSGGEEYPAAKKIVTKMPCDENFHDEISSGEIDRGENIMHELKRSEISMQRNFRWRNWTSRKFSAVRFPATEFHMANSRIYW